MRPVIASAASPGGHRPLRRHRSRRGGVRFRRNGAGVSGYGRKIARVSGYACRTAVENTLGLASASLRHSRVVRLCRKPERHLCLLLGSRPMRTFVGTVSQLRSVAVTTTSSTASSTRHETSIRFGDFSLNMKTKTQPSIHIGDQLRVFGILLGSTVWPILLRNEQNSYEAGFVSLRDVVVPALFGAGLLLASLATRTRGWAMLGIVCFAAAAVVALLRYFASSAIRRSRARSEA